jgi:phosphonate transport system ATP-binding protein
MDALRTINKQDKITVICNLHTLDAARAYCDRIVGMAHGHVVFDGSPAQLTSRVIHEIYGGDTENAVDESLTSTMAAHMSASAAMQREMAEAQ